MYSAEVARQNLSPKCYSGEKRTLKSVSLVQIVSPGIILHLAKRLWDQLDESNTRVVEAMNKLNSLSRESRAVYDEALNVWKLGTVQGAENQVTVVLKDLCGAFKVRHLRISALKIIHRSFARC